MGRWSAWRERGRPQVEKDTWPPSSQSFNDRTGRKSCHSGGSRGKAACLHTAAPKRWRHPGHVDPTEHGEDLGAVDQCGHCRPVWAAPNWRRGQPDSDPWLETTCKATAAKAAATSRVWEQKRQGMHTTLSRRTLSLAAAAAGLWPGALSLVLARRHTGGGLVRRSSNEERSSEKTNTGAFVSAWLQQVSSRHKMPLQ